MFTFPTGTVINSVLKVCPKENSKPIYISPPAGGILCAPLCCVIARMCAFFCTGCLGTVRTKFMSASEGFGSFSVLKLEKKSLIILPGPSIERCGSDGRHGRQGVKAVCEVDRVVGFGNLGKLQLLSSVKCLLLTPRKVYLGFQP